MKNNKVIVINGFQRGGTNIVYNILQSHPLVCSPNDLETGQIISQSYRLYPYHKLQLIKYLIKRLKLILYSLLDRNFILNSFFGAIIGNFYDSIFYKYKKKNYNNPYNRFKYKNIPSSKNEIKNTVLCLKSVHYDIKLTNFFSRIYDNIFFIGLVRNGYALCEGWIRRGKTAEFSGKRYREYCERMIRDSKRYKNYRIIKFEDIINDPFGMASELYKFTQLKPISLEKLRFKVKKILTKDGLHKVKYGKEDVKYWFNSKNVKDLLDPKINLIQIKKLSEADKEDFETFAYPILEYFDYRKQKDRIHN